MNMSDPGLLFASIGAGAGIIGAITGIAGAIFGYKGYKRSKDVRSLDIRLELRKDVNALDQDLIRLTDLIVESHQSKQRRASADGWFRSGAMEKWTQDVKNDQEKIEELKRLSPKKSVNFDLLNEKQLEAKLVEVHDLQLTITTMLKKYEDSLSDDRENAKLIRKAAEERHRR